MSTAHQAVTTPLKDVNTEGKAVALRLRDVRKVFAAKGGNQVVAVDSTSLDVHEGEFIVLLGPSGCGKTTLLRCLAGLEQPDSGYIEIFGQVVYSSADRIVVPPEDRGISMVFQSYALWPHMSVAKNVAYPLRYGRGPKLTAEEIRERVNYTLNLVGIGGLGNRYPNQLSGGQQQRVALARALVSGAKVVLFDEPLSNVDAKVREQLRAEILEMQSKVGFTAFYVTHDQAEAMQMADRVAVINHGKVVQLGSPREIYRRPANRDAAYFVGSMNEVVGHVVGATGGRVEIKTNLGSLYADDVQAAALPSGTRVVAVWRPERLALHQERPSTAVNAWTGHITANHFLGAHTEHVILVNGVPLRQWSHLDDVLEGIRVWVAVDPGDIRVFPLDADATPGGGTP